MTRSLLKSAALLSALTFMACDVEGTLNDSLDDLEQKAIESAFEQIKSTTEAAGGTAGMVFPDKETVLEVTDPSSPLFGAKVVLPAGTLPDGTEHAAATIQTPGETPGGAGTEGKKFVGPYAAVGIVALPDGAVVTPAQAVAITLPHSYAATAPTAQLSLGVFIAHGAQVNSVEGSSADDKSATGSTTDLEGVFSTLWTVDYDGGAAPPNSWIYKVFNADDSVACVGHFDYTSTFVGSVSYQGNTGTLTVNTGAAGALAYTSTGNSFVKPNNITVPQNAGATTFTCDNRTFSPQTINEWSLQLTGFDEAAATATLAGQFEFTTAAGEVVQAAIAATVPMSWTE